MAFTGKRYVPAPGGQTKYENLHRYVFLLELAAGKSILDIGSGEGYGAALLAKTASSVIGIDIDSATVAHANRTYQNPNLSFLVGSYDRIPLQDGSVDVVTSFETIEHQDEHHEMLTEIKRVLKPGGVLIISSPNRSTYSDIENDSNPSHVKGLNYEELCNLLSGYFKYFKCYGQRLATASFLFSLQNLPASDLKTYSGNVDRLTQKIYDLNSPVYFVAICSDTSAIAEQLSESIYIDPAEELFNASEAKIEELNRKLIEQRDERLSIRQSYLNQSVILNNILNSYSWKITSPLRRIFDLLNDPNTKSSLLPQKTLPVEVSATNDSASQDLAEQNILSPQNSLDASKRFLTDMAKQALSNFLLSNSTLEIPQFEKPEISIILVLFNRAELTLQCLSSILTFNRIPFEVIIVDNNSTDKTKPLLSRINGAQIIENTENLHFLLACNQAAKQARGDYILLLNNDTKLLTDSLSIAKKTIESSEDIGAVGGKIIWPDGMLQEAGCIIWQDGSCIGYGRGDSPLAPEYMFRRDVDYCSGAFLLTRRAIFLEEGGFDEAYKPAYYEETDYCVRLWKSGKRVVYDPDIAILHCESASSSSSTNVSDLLRKNHETFKRKNRDWLALQQEGSGKNILEARSRRSREKRILFIDDMIPHSYLGPDFLSSNQIVSNLVKKNYLVTLYPLNSSSEDWLSVYTDIPREVEIMIDHSRSELEEFINSRIGYYGFFFTGRSQNIEFVKSLLSRRPDLFEGVKIIHSVETI
jgi:GT2 family glycosyltransferase/ubiquinone/menaquinone biosynthesis C-methylase UbiE